MRTTNTYLCSFSIQFSTIGFNKFMIQETVIVLTYTCVGPTFFVKIKTHQIIQIINWRAPNEKSMNFALNFHQT